MQNPPCVNGDDDPTPSIRASLSMLFFAFLAMVLCLQVPYIKLLNSKSIYCTHCNRYSCEHSLYNPVLTRLIYFLFLLQVSYRAARAEWARHGANSDDEYKYVSKGRGGRGSRSSRSEGSYHEREESHFLAQPVPSSDSEHSSASSGRGGGGGAVGTRTRQQRHHAKNDNDIGDEEIGEGEEGEEEEEEEEAISFRLPSAGVAV